MLSLLLYGAETWKMTRTISNKLDTFQNKCLRRIFKIFWPDTIRNEELLRKAKLPTVTTVVKRRRWRWLGHVLRKPPSSIPRIALKWTPDGKRPKGRPRETWRRTIEREMKENGWTWGQLQKQAGDRTRWRALVAALYANEHEED